MTKSLWAAVALMGLMSASPAHAQFFGGGGVPDGVMRTLSEDDGPDTNSGRDAAKSTSTVERTASPTGSGLPGALSGRMAFASPSIHYGIEIRVEISSLRPFRGRVFAPIPQRVGSDSEFSVAAAKRSRWYTLADGRVDGDMLSFRMPGAFWPAGASAELKRRGPAYRGTFTFKTPTGAVPFDEDGDITLVSTKTPSPIEIAAAEPPKPKVVAAPAPAPAPKPQPKPKPVVAARPAPGPSIAWNQPRQPVAAPKPAAPAPVVVKPAPALQPVVVAAKPAPRPAPAPVVAAKPVPRPSAADNLIASLQPLQRSNSTVTVPAIDGHRLALVIGNGSYQAGRLANPVNDAKLISGVLRRVGFEVIEELDASQRQMKRAIQRFGDQLDKYGKNAVALFYYAGHGIQAGGRNYLIPVDATIRRETDLDIEAVPADWVVQQLEFAKSALNVIILDACRNNPFARGFRSAGGGLARMDAPTGTLIAYSTAPGDVAADGDGANSPYSQALARAMLMSATPVEQAFKEVRVAVRGATKGAQTPWELSSLTGDFFFIPPAQQGKR